MRKPDFCFYKFIKADPTFVVFADDRFENVHAARSMGMNGIVFDDIKRAIEGSRSGTSSENLRAADSHSSRCERVCRNLKPAAVKRSLRTLHS
jgi:FMN phosphatase YigB (HAD superfamily)